MSYLTQLIARIEARTALVGVVGLGYVGLPLADAVIRAGFQVLGFDTDPDKVGSLLTGRSYVSSVPHSMIAGWGDRFTATNRMEQLDRPDVILVCVPTPIDDHRCPDFSFLDTTANWLTGVLRPGQLIVLESTVPPGTTLSRFGARIDRSGKVRSEEWFLAYSPEREDPGRTTHTVATIPKVVGADHEADRMAAACFYGAIVRQVVPVSSTLVAEAAKVLENTFRTVNIALVNELKLVFARMGIDVWEVIEAASTKPFGFMPFYPGPGVGGACLPKDPFLLAWAARSFGGAPKFVELAGEINEAMPDNVIDVVARGLGMLGKPLFNARVGVLGVAYKADLGDTRSSPGIELLARLRDRGALVTYHDPHVPIVEPTRRHPGLRLESAGLKTCLTNCDAVVVATAHKAIDWDLVAEVANLVVDTRHVMRGRSIGGLLLDA